MWTFFSLCGDILRLSNLYGYILILAKKTFEQLVKEVLQGLLITRSSNPDKENDAVPDVSPQSDLSGLTMGCS
ncbi:TPA_asm: hypothetical protein G0B27_22680 [Salmonella enterica subsp. indica]|uniref:Uncharacterized protein n=1 Tax=Salmonella enterica TaxID=28901 RepID=A0A701ZIJ6_SALER|nr:hypothetical protein [Salmonella enterica subsp. indica]